jgi:hypothetical protein
MCAAERGQEIVKRGFIGYVNRSELQAPLVFVVVEQVVVAETDIKQVPRRDAGRIMVVVLGAWGWKRDQS